MLGFQLNAWMDAGVISREAMQKDQQLPEREICECGAVSLPV